MESNWTTVRADQFCTSITDGTHDSPKPQQAGRKLITSKHLKGHYIDFDSANWISEADYKKVISRSAVEQWDILFSMIGTIGNIYLEKNPVVEYACKNIGIFKFSGNKEDAFWMYYYLKSPQAKAYIQSHLRGSTQAYIPLGGLREMPVQMPDKKVRDSIISILRPIDEKIELNAAINDNLQQQAQTLFSECFCLRSGDPLPQGWVLSSLGDVAVISNKSFNPLKQPETMLEHYSIPAFDETRYPVFELSTAIKSNKFIVDADCFMISKLNPTTKRVWRPYCITRATVCSTEFIVYKAKDRKLTEFLYSLIDSSSFSDFMCSHVTGSTGSRQRTIPLDTLQYQFYLPTAEEIADFSAIVAPIYAQIRVNAMENARLKDLRDSLLPRLMSGEIDVSAIDI